MSDSCSHPDGHGESYYMPRIRCDWCGGGCCIDCSSKRFDKVACEFCLKEGNVPMKDWRNMRIAAAAVKKGPEVYSLPPPARHHDVLQHMAKLGVQQDEETTQGFLTECGEFVRRKPAMMIAEHAGQLQRKQGPGTYQGPELFSEDLW